MRTTRRALLGIGLFTVFLAVAGPAFGDLEDDLEREWVGAWVVARVEVASDCSGFYTNTEVHGRLSTSKGSRRFGAGELARVDKLNQKSDRVDLYLSVDEPVLLSRQDGPFTLYDERSCRVQLLVDVPKSTIKGGRRDEVNALLLAAVERYESAESARRSATWSRRERDPLPRDYEETLARHAAWQAEEANRALVRARQAALEEASRTLERVVEDPSYLAGFAAGVEAQRRRSAPGCSSAASARFESDERTPRDSRGNDSEVRAYRRGFRDGQVVAWSTRLARSIEGCLVAVSQPY